MLLGAPSNITSAEANTYREKMDIDLSHCCTIVDASHVDIDLRVSI